MFCNANVFGFFSCLVHFITDFKRIGCPFFSFAHHVFDCLLSVAFLWPDFELQAGTQKIIWCLVL